MTIIIVSLAMRMVAIMITATLSQRYALEGYWAKAILLMGLFINLWRGAFLRAIELRMLYVGRTDDLVNGYKLIQSAPMAMFQDIVILAGAFLCFSYYYRKAKKLHKVK